MTMTRLAVAASVCAAFWTIIISAGIRYGWAEAGTWAVMIIVGAVLIGAIWIKVEEDQQELDFQESLREAEGYDDPEDTAA